MDTHVTKMDTYVVKHFDDHGQPVYNLKRLGTGEVLATVFDEPGKTEEDVRYALNTLADKAKYKILYWVER